MVEIEIPFRPLGREDIQRLEATLLIATVSREDVIDKMRKASPKDRITWIDSLAIAAGALAREKAGMPVSKIAEELGRVEETIRAHLASKTEAGKLVRETYEKLLKGEVTLPFLAKMEAKAEESKEFEQKVQELQEKIDRIKEKLKELLNEIEA